MSDVARAIRERLAALDPETLDLVDEIERSPRVSVMCPLCPQPLKRSTT